ncbi:1-phosphatidylinositol 4,5-bisphosphate phosphodiesterase eta-2 [Bagarius yarrelli]|uniref:Phosphoinositide phospholipase C n=1 Tax=Bagarius yarrelli TaxID=175774 RepID=A0A556U230_BAGYA|nr:1-phosphatidylinositol 4,5-bisphosphate phosphodiesterase eta-2 [Bagarius yarrelli]
MMSTRRDLYLLMLTYSNHKDHLDTDDLARFLEIEQKMTKVTTEHCLEIVAKFEPCPENQKQGVLGIDGFTNYMRSPAGDIFNPEHYEVNQDMTQPLCKYFIASSHNTYLMGDQLMSQSRVDMYSWVLQAGCRCVEVDCWDGQDGEPIVHHGYTLTSKILFKDVIETINKYAFVKNPYPVILSIENHCSVPQQKKMAQYLVEILGEKLDVSSIKADETGFLPSPDSLKGKILVKGKKLPPNIDENAEEGDVSDEDSADEMEDDCKLMNGDTSVNRKQVENVAKKKLDSLMKESKIRDREDPDSFTIAALPPSAKRDEKTAIKKTNKLKKTSSFEDTDTDQESSSSASKVPIHHSRRKKTMKLSRALSDLVKYTKSVAMQDLETQGSSSWLVSSLSETKAHQMIQQKPAQFVRFNQRQLTRVYPSSYRVDSSNFNPQPFWNIGCHLVALNYQSEGRVLQLNRAKFYSNGNCGYVLKPNCMCEGPFNPLLEDPLPGETGKQLVLKIISGQQLPKPKDSMLGDRGEIIDPFVEVEVIGLALDCSKEQTRVVDDNGFNPMWEETLVFNVHMPEITLVRFLVWDHDPIGQDFIGQRTIAFNSMMPGYRHVYLEGKEEASIFVHVAVNDITGKARPANSIKGLFHRNPKQASLDSHAAALHSRKPAFGAHLLRRTASAPTKGQPKVKRGFPEISIDTKDCSSEGASSERESEEGPAAHPNGDTAASARSWEHGTNGQLHQDNGTGKVRFVYPEPRAKPLHNKGGMSEPITRANRLKLQDSLEKRSIFTCVTVNSSGRLGITSSCIRCMIGTKESPDLERKIVANINQGRSSSITQRVPCLPSAIRQLSPEPCIRSKALALPKQPKQPNSKLDVQSNKSTPMPRVHSKVRQTLDFSDNPAPGTAFTRNTSSYCIPQQIQPPAAPASTISKAKTGLSGQLTLINHGSNSLDSSPTNGDKRLSKNNWSSCSSLDSLELLPTMSQQWMDKHKRVVGTLQREMNSLFDQKMEEIRSNSPLFFTGKTLVVPLRDVVDLSVFVDLYGCSGLQITAMNSFK